MRITTFVYLSALCVVSCRNDHQSEPQPAYSQYYTLTYDVTGNYTDAHASFGYPSATTNTSYLPDGYAIMCNDVPCSQVIEYDIPPTSPGMGYSCYYHNQFPGRTDLNFVFKKSDGREFHNSISAAGLPTIDFDSAFTSISRSDTTVIHFTGGPRQSNEGVNIVIHQANHNPPYTSNITPVAVGDSTITLLPSDLNVISNGSATLYIYRSVPTGNLEEYDSASGYEHSAVRATREITITN